MGAICALFFVIAYGAIVASGRAVETEIAKGPVDLLPVERRASERRGRGLTKLFKVTPWMTGKKFLMGWCRREGEPDKDFCPVDKNHGKRRVGDGATASISSPTLTLPLNREGIFFSASGPG